MRIAELIEYHLRQQGFIGTVYKGFLPPSPDTAIVLTLTAGLNPDPKHNYNSTGLQVRTRAISYPTSEALAWSVFDKLHSLSTTTVSGVFFVDVQAQQDPFSLGRDESDRHQFAQNFLIEYYTDLQYRSD